MQTKDENLDPNHPDSALVLTNLGNAHGTLGDYQKQIDFLEKALEI